MNVIFRYLIVISMLIQVAACSRKRSSAKPVYKQTPVTQAYYLTIDDVECEECADSVLDIITSCPEVQSAEYCQATDDFTNGYVKVCLADHRSLPKDCIQALLSEEGFKLARTTTAIPSQSQSLIV